MKRLLLIILVLALVYPVLAADPNATMHVPSEEQLRDIVREFPTVPPVPEPTEAILVDVVYTDYSPGLIEQVIDALRKIIIPEKEKRQTITDLVNSTPTEVMAKPQTVVAIEGENVALISQSSELNGKPVHEFCNRMGFGTSEWKACEESMI